MTQENTKTAPDAVETDQNAAKCFEGMAKKIEQCGCCGDMMEKMKSFMPAMCGGASDNSEGKAETEAETEDKTDEPPGSSDANA